MLDALLLEWRIYILRLWHLVLIDLDLFLRQYMIALILSVLGVSSRLSVLLLSEILMKTVIFWLHIGRPVMLLILQWDLLFFQSYKWIF